MWFVCYLKSDHERLKRDKITCKQVRVKNFQKQTKTYNLPEYARERNKIFSGLRERRKCRGSGEWLNRQTKNCPYMVWIKNNHVCFTLRTWFFVRKIFVFSANISSEIILSPILARNVFREQCLRTGNSLWVKRRNFLSKRFSGKKAFALSPSNNSVHLTWLAQTKLLQGFDGHFTNCIMNRLLRFSRSSGLSRCKPFLAFFSFFIAKSVFLRSIRHFVFQNSKALVLFPWQPTNGARDFSSMNVLTSHLFLLCRTMYNNFSIHHRLWTVAILGKM